MTRIQNLIRLSRPLYLLLSALTYILGAGIARYLGHGQDVNAFWLGMGWVFLLQLSASMLTEVFRPTYEPLILEETPVERIALRNALLLIAATALTSAAVIILLMLTAGLMTPPVLMFLGLAVLAALAYGVPPLRLVNTGFGELTLAILIADLIPALAFLLQTGELHRLLVIVAIPLTALALAFFIVLNFSAYAIDIKYVRRTLLTRLGWERAVPLHHFLILTAYLLFAISPLLGFPWVILWPVFLTLPFGILQVLWLRNIALGGRPVWNFLTTLATSVFGLTAYVLTLNFWIR